MNFIRPLVFSAACALLGTAAWSANHLEAAAKEPMAMMDSQIKAMREVREKMMNAKTPEERNALMEDYVKTMQGGMPADMATRQQMMEKRMEMMETTMQMMMDRLPPAAK